MFSTISELIGDQDERIRILERFLKNAAFELRAVGNAEKGADITGATIRNAETLAIQINGLFDGELFK